MSLENPQVLQGLKSTHFIVDSFLSDIANDITEDDVWDTIYIDLPTYFINSTNPNKAVEIELARVIDFSTWAEGAEVISSMHSDIAEQDASADNYVCATNTLYNNPKTYLVGANKNTIECWFRKIDGTLINLHPNSTRIIVEMILRY